LSISVPDRTDRVYLECPLARLSIQFWVYPPSKGFEPFEGLRRLQACEWSLEKNGICAEVRFFPNRNVLFELTAKMRHDCGAICLFGEDKSQAENTRIGLEGESGPLNGDCQAWGGHAWQSSGREYHQSLRLHGGDVQFEFLWQRQLGFLAVLRSIYTIQTVYILKLD
jgi:hypothetical protein